MAGIRSFNTNLPHVFRYPEWVEGVFYPSGSVVAVEIIDSDVYYDFYAAIRDIQNLTTWPPGNQGEWRLLHDAFQIDSDTIAALKDFDSEKTRIYEALDSERLATQSADSDIRLDLDSEILARQSADSDILISLDSETHDRKAADSDIWVYLRDHDSDLAVLYARSDSDILTMIQASIDSEILARFSGDSDILRLISQAVHDYLANDSEFDSEVMALKRRMDSDFAGAVRDWNLTGVSLPWGPQPFVSNTDYYINQKYITNHTTGWLWLVDHDDQFGTRTPTIYIIKDGQYYGSAPGGLLTTNINVGVLGDFVRGTQILDGGGGADVDVYRNFGDALPEVTNANLWTVQERVKERAHALVANDLDTAFRRTVMTVIDMDSDLHALIRGDSENDSDHLQFRHDLLKLDSDVKILMADRDSDNGAIQQLSIRIDSERHDWKAGDSDVLQFLRTAFDSDLRLTLEHDSELFIQTDSEERARRNADSDLNNGYTGFQFRYVRTEYTAPNITGTVNINFDAAGAVLSVSSARGFWCWNTFNNRLIIVDSDGSLVYTRVHLGEPTEVSKGQYRWRRGADTLVNANIQLNGANQVVDDLWQFQVDHITTWDNGGEITTILDSDIQLHDEDSDKTTAMVWLGYKLRYMDSDMKQEVHDRKAGDSDLRVEFDSDLDSEIHDRKAADSDLQIQIWDNDSDIAYLYENTMKFRGTLDLTREAPTHTAYQKGDVYLNNGAGAVVMGMGWTGIEGLGIEKGWSVVYTDSDVWSFFGAAGGGKDSDTVNTVPSLAWLETTSDATAAYRRHMNQRKLHTTRDTGITFTQDDSDRTWLIYGEAPSGPKIYDGYKVTGQNRIVISTAYMGANTSGRIRFERVDKNSDSFGIIAVGGATATIVDAVNGDSEVLVTLNDSEVDAFSITVSRAITPDNTYIITYTDEVDSEVSQIISYDGVNFRRWYQWEKNANRIEKLDEKDMQFIGGVDPAQTAPVTSTYGDVYRVKVGGFPDPSWTGLDTTVQLTQDSLIIRGDSDYWYAVGGSGGKTYNYINTDIQAWHAGADNDILTATQDGRFNVNLTLDYFGQTINAVAAVSETFDANTPFIRAFNGGDFACSGNGNAHFEIRFDRPVRAHILEIQGRPNNNEYFNTYQARGYETDSDFTAGRLAVMGPSISRGDANTKRMSVFFDPNTPIRFIRVDMSGGFGTNPGIGNIRLRLADELITVPPHKAAMFRRNSTTYSDNVSLAYNVKSLQDYYSNNNDIGSNNEYARIVFWKKVDKFQRIFTAKAMNSVDNGWTNLVNEVDNNEWSRPDSDLQSYIVFRETTNDPAGITHLSALSIQVDDYSSRSYLDLALSSIDSEIQKKIEWLIIQDSDNDSDWKQEVHDRKAADSDLLLEVGRTFVQSTNPNPTPALRKGDTWIDTSDNKLYYYSETTSVWVQVIGVV